MDIESSPETEENMKIDLTTSQRVMEKPRVKRRDKHALQVQQASCAMFQARVQSDVTSSHTSYYNSEPCT